MSQIPKEVSDAMFRHAKVDRDALFIALRHMGPHYLRGEFLAEWSEDNPSRNFGYVVSEWLMTRAPMGTFAFRVRVPGGAADYHYFLRWADGVIIDLTAEQFPDWKLVDYAAAKKCSFAAPTPSKRANVLGTLMDAQLCRKFDVDNV